ncbi:unnamed protein product, partial [Adineta ricciae]
LPENIKLKQLENLFSSIGPLKSCRLVENGGYAFVEYLNGEEDAKLALDKFNGLKIGNKTIQIQKSRRNCTETKNCKLFVKGFPNDFNENDLKVLFEQFGQIIQIRFIKDKSFAFILMATHEQAENILKNLNNYQITSNHTLQIKFHEKISHNQVDFNENSFLFISNFNSNINENDLRNLFSPFGTILSLKIIYDQLTGLSK